MAAYTIKKGMDIKLAGSPENEIVNSSTSSTLALLPAEFPGAKPKLLVKEGDEVNAGQPLFYDKRNEALKGTLPQGGTVKEIVYGARRSIQKIIIDVDPDKPSVDFPTYTADQLLQTDAEELSDLLHRSGVWALIKERPFSNIANKDHAPKSIFVNAMQTAPFGADCKLILQGVEAELQAGINALTRFTEGSIHVCKAPELQLSVDHAEVHTFKGPHPAGNTSVHIHHIDPISPGQVVWTVYLSELIQIGSLLLHGKLPQQKIVSLAGPGVVPSARRHYRVDIGAPIQSLTEKNLEKGEQRIVCGSALYGDTVEPDGYISLYAKAFTVIPEEHEQLFMGWLAPGLNRYSHSPTYLSRWLKPGKSWALNTNMHGSKRAMVLTTWYDRYVPMKIMTDYLVRAVLAHDTTEAVELGILETDPEDFALCSFICPSKTDVPGIIRKGLKEVEEEGI